MTTDITPRNNMALTKGERDPLDAFQQAEKDELILPVRKLVQGVSRDADRKRAGEFYDTITKEYQPSLSVAILGMTRSRSLFGQSFDDPPLCTSDDAKKPRELVTVAGVGTGPTCAECVFSQWGTARDGKGKGQACSMSYNLICFDLTDRIPFIFRIRGASIRAWREYLTAGQMKRTPAYAIRTNITSKEETFDAGVAYTLEFGNGGPLDEDDVAWMRDLAADFQEMKIVADEEPEVTEEPDW